MPRVARLDTPGLLHHVMIRGIERRRIFKDNKDRENLIERLSKLLPKTKTQCYAWVFMPNKEEDCELELLIFLILRASSFTHLLHMPSFPFSPQEIHPQHHGATCSLTTSQDSPLLTLKKGNSYQIRSPHVLW